MKIYHIILLSLISTNIWSISSKDLVGSWVRTYGVFQNWSASGSTSGVMIKHDEQLDFHLDNIVYVMDASSATIKGKSMFMLTKKDGKDFIVLYDPKQNPNDQKIHREQGYFVSIHKNDKGGVEIHFTTMRDMEKGVKFTASYDKLTSKDENVQFIVPNNAK